MKSLLLILFTMAAFSAGYVSAVRWTKRGHCGPRVLGAFVYVLLLCGAAWVHRYRGLAQAGYLLSTFVAAALVHSVEAQSVRTLLGNTGEFAVYQTEPCSTGPWAAVKRFTRDVSDCDSRLLLVVLYFLFGLLMFPFLVRRRQVVAEKDGQTASSWLRRGNSPGSIHELQRPF
jgi:hypothetical protein